MLKPTWILSLTLLLVATAASGTRVSESYGRLPLHFEANRGQAHEDVRFLARGPGYGLYLTAGEAVLALGAKKQTVLRMALVGAARDAQVSGLEELSGKANYFIGKDPAKWRTNVPTYAKVHYREVYPGIDLVYYGNQRQLEYDFVVAPGADPRKILLGFSGMDKIEIDSQGDLVLHAAGGAIHQRKPVIYQEVDGVRQEIAGSYVRKSANRVGFKLAAYDTSRPLIIDPVLLSYSSYLGGSTYEFGQGIAVDTEGNAYVTGVAWSTDFPTTSEALQPAFGGGSNDAFVAKIDPTGSTLVYSTYLGGSGDEWGQGITVDTLGNAYVTGFTSSANFPATAAAVQPTASGARDAFVAKLNPTGTELTFSTYLGGSGRDEGSGIALDSDGNAYVSGRTVSSDFPTTPEAFQQAFSGGFEPLCVCTGDDAFVAKLNPAGSALVYSTYLGGTGRDYGFAIAVDTEGNAYVTGGTTGSFPTTAGAFQASRGGVFVTKLDPAGSSLVYSTYLGTGYADIENGRGIAVDADGNAYVTGYTLARLSQLTLDCGE